MPVGKRLWDGGVPGDRRRAAFQVDGVTCWENLATPHQPRRYQAHLDGTLEMGGGNSTNLQFGIGSTGGGSVQLMQDSYCIVH
jgi:hypothetical protein